MTTVYAGLMVASHEWAQQFIRNIQQDPAWTWAALISMVLILLGLSVFFVRQWKRHTTPQRNRVLIVSWVSTGFIVLSAQWLLVSVHTEAIHYLQYGILTALVFSLTRRIPVTLLIVILVGIADEAYQYWVLYAGWVVYFDMNDVILNALAAGVALLFLLSTVPEEFRDSESDPWIVKNIDLLILGGLAVLLLLGITSGLIAKYRYPESLSQNALLIMDRDRVSHRFWTHAWWSGRYYHHVKLVPGMIALMLIAQYYRFTLPWLLPRHDR